MIITIPGNTPSLKNSKRIISWDGRPRLVPSKHYESWADRAKWELRAAQVEPIDGPWPVRVDFHFVRADRRRFDYINLAQGPLDLLVELGILPDDDMVHVVPGSFSWSIDKQNPRCDLVIRGR